MIRHLTEADLDLHDLYDVDDFFALIENDELWDADGYGLPVYDGREVDESLEIVPSIAWDEGLPDDVTHVLWITA